jgi:hypothetical protein
LIRVGLISARLIGVARLIEGALPDTVNDTRLRVVAATIIVVVIT